jgi:exopolysaccharide biosynthesis WecB/TagA/CpsF family protein
MNISTARSIADSIRPIDTGLKPLLDEMFAERSYVVAFVNAHAVNLACENPAFLSSLLRADLLLRDGLGVKILMKAVDREPGLNMNGTDLIPRILEACQARPIALYGSTAEVAQAAAAAVREMGAATVTHCDGFQPLETYLERIKAERPRVIVLGMGMPKQEMLADAIINTCPGPVLILNGGAVLDFMSGRFRRAPVSMRRMGMEWLFRLALEPRRLWRRYLVGNVVFLVRASLAGLQCRCTPGRPPPDNGPVSRKAAPPSR